MRSVKEEFGSLKNLLITIIEKDPDVVNYGDTELYLRCCEELGGYNTDDIRKIKGLNATSVLKCRQVLTNKLKLYKIDDDVKEMRKERRKEIRDYMREFKQAN